MINLPINNINPTVSTTLSFKSFVSVLCGLAVMLSAVFFLNIEENLNLFELFGIAVIGFLVYAFIPFSFKLPFLFLLNVGAILIMLGPIDGILMLIYSLSLFGILNLPIKVKWRTVFLVLVGLVLAMARLKFILLPHGSIILPVLGGLFMFRAVLFLHEQRFIKVQETWWLRLNYFFLLPNLIFVIFPVVDYKTFIKNFYSKPATETYHKGVLLIANGIFHLFLYRLIYYYLIPNPTDIQDVYGWLQFVVTSYALIVRLAGIFHISAGIICLFGFDLPPTFNHYFFANSFSDLWRRVNMYWRNFVMKVFYYPIYFKLKNLGTVKAIAVSILITFVFNWLLHTYQWFWVRGSVLFTIQDTSFWAVFGITVMLNSVYQALPRQKKQLSPGFHFINSCVLSLRIIGIFLFMAFLWSWWTTPSIMAWWGLLSIWETVTTSQILTILIGLIVWVLIYTIFQFFRYHYDHMPANKKLSTKSIYVMVVVGIGLVSLIGLPNFSKQIEKKFKFNMEPVLHTQLNDADRETQFKGYYETMLAGNNLLATPLDETEGDKPEDWRQLHTLDALDRTDNLLTKNLKPNLDLIFKGALLTTNEFGLRDRPVQKNTPANTLRIALMGGSIEMGSGVTTEQTFENLVEDSLNKEHFYKLFEKVEIVNFAIPGTHLPQHMARVDKIVPEFEPSVIIYTAHSDEISRIINAMYRIYVENINVAEYTYLDSLYKSLELPRSVDESTFKRKIRPHMMSFMTWGLSHIKNNADAMGAVPVWMFINALDGKQTDKEDKQIEKLAADLGFYTLDLHNYQGDYPIKDIILRSWDSHPNKLGHQLIANKMIEAIKKNDDLNKRINDNYYFKK